MTPRRRATTVAVGAMLSGLAAAAIVAGPRPDHLPGGFHGVKVNDHPTCPAGFTREAFGNEPTPSTRAYVLDINDPQLTPGDDVRDAYAVTLVARADADIDHVRSLRSAWCAGAASWSPEMRRAYARASANLVPTRASVNRSKGDRDPDTWRPEVVSSWCDYGIRWLTTTRTWGLTATRAQLRAVAELFTACP